MRIQQCFLIIILAFLLLPFQQAVAQSPSPSPSPLTTPSPEPTPFEFETIPGNTAMWTGIGGEDSYFQGGIFQKILQRFKTFSVVFGRLIDGDYKIDVPNFERWGKWMETSVFPDNDNTGGPLIPYKLKVRIPQKEEGNNLQIQQVNQPCSSESDVVEDTEGNPLGQKRGKPTDVLVSDTYDEYAYNYITGCSILMGLFGSQKQNGRTVSMPSLAINTKEQVIYKETAPKKFEFKEELYDPKTGDSSILYPCESQSKGRKVNKTLWKVLNGGLIAGTGSLAFQQTADTLSDYFDGAGNCIRDLAECIAAAKQALGLGLETTIFGPGLVGLNACWMGIRDQDLPNGVNGIPPDARKNLNSYLGVERTFISNKSASYQPIDYDDRHGTVKGRGLAVADAPEPSETPVPYSGFSGTVNASAYTQCAILPNRLQPTMLPSDPQNNTGPSSCNPVKDPGSMYSSDANIGTFPPDYHSDVPPYSGDFGTALKNAASTVGIPACVLQGVAFLEGGGRYAEKPLDQCLREVNHCSAAGPMQFTTGTGPADDPECQQCGVKYCPNAWASWGAGGNPCNYQDALAAAARKLKNDGPLTNADPKSQLSQILYAGYRYYGSKLPLEQTGRTGLGDLGKCSYGQVLYKTCDPSYQCSGKGG